MQWRPGSGFSVLARAPNLSSCPLSSCPPVILPPCHPGLRAGISDHRRPFNIIEAPDLEIPALRFAPAGMTRMGALRPG